MEWVYLPLWGYIVSMILPIIFFIRLIIIEKGDE